MKLSSFKQMGIRLAQALNAARLSQERNWQSASASAPAI